MVLMAADPGGSAGRRALKMVLPPGFRFHPTDEELLGFYLRRRVRGKKVQSNVIAEVDNIYGHDPWQLPALSCIASRASESWYFFHRSDRKYPNGSRTNRATPSGYWKATGRDRRILNALHVVATSSPARGVIGFKKTLVFYHGKAPSGQRTDWVMHEYQLSTSTSNSNSNSNDNNDVDTLSSNYNIISHNNSLSSFLVVCRIMKKKVKPSQYSLVPSDQDLSISGSPSSCGDFPDESTPSDHPHHLELPTICLYAHLDEDSTYNNHLDLHHDHDHDHKNLDLDHEVVHDELRFHATNNLHSKVSSITYRPHEHTQHFDVNRVREMHDSDHELHQLDVGIDDKHAPQNISFASTSTNHAQVYLNVRKDCGHVDDNNAHAVV